DLKKLQTEIRDGLAVVRVEFDANADVDRKYDDVVREVNALRPTLPSDLARLDIKKFDASQVNIIQVALVSDSRPVYQLADRAKALKDRLERVPGVRTVERWGYPEREVRVDLDLGRLARIGLPLQQVLGAIGSENVNIPGGTVSAAGRSFTVKTSGSYR